MKIICIKLSSLVLSGPASPAEMLSFANAILILLYASLIAAIPSAAPVLPAKGVVSVASLVVELDGSGCKPGQVSVNLAADNSAMTIILDNFVAADGPKAITSNTRAFCRVTIGMNLLGWAFDISSADFRGYVYLEVNRQIRDTYDIYSNDVFIHRKVFKPA